MFINNLYFPHMLGGAEVSTQITCEELARAGHDVSVYSLAEGDQEYLREVNGVKVHYLPISNIYWPFTSRRPASWRKLAFFLIDAFNFGVGAYFNNEIKKQQPDVVHTSNLYGFSPAIWWAAQKNAVPIVHTLRDYYLICKNSKMFGDGGNCKKQCESCRIYSIPRRCLSKKVAAVIGVSNHILKTHLELGAFSPESITQVIHNPFVPNAVDENPARDDISDDFVFGFIGRVAPEKGIQQLVEAFARLNEPRAKLIVAGDYENNYKEFLLERCAKIGGAEKRARVVFLGKIKAPEFYRKINALVMPSIWHEPFGRGVVEAYSFGIPVISASRGGLPEIVLDRNYSCFDPESSESIISSMNWAISAKHDSSLIRIYASRFDVKNLAPSLVSVYSKVVANSDAIS